MKNKDDVNPNSEFTLYVDDEDLKKAIEADLRMRLGANTNIEPSLQSEKKSLDRMDNNEKAKRFFRTLTDYIGFEEDFKEQLNKVDVEQLDEATKKTLDAVAKKLTKSSKKLKNHKTFTSDLSSVKLSSVAIKELQQS